MGRSEFETLPSQSLLLVVNKVLQDDFSGPLVGLMMDLHMLIVAAEGAREPSEAAYRSLLEGTGFSKIETRRLDPPRDLILAQKP